MTKGEGMRSVIKEIRKQLREKEYKGWKNNTLYITPKALNILKKQESEHINLTLVGEKAEELLTVLGLVIFELVPRKRPYSWNKDDVYIHERMLEEKDSGGKE